MSRALLIPPPELAAYLLALSDNAFAELERKVLWAAEVCNDGTFFYGGWSKEGEPVFQWWADIAIAFGPDRSEWPERYLR